MSSDKNDLLNVIADNHNTLAEFARKSFAVDGRGVVRFEVPSRPRRSSTVFGVTDMVYHTLEEMKEFVADLSGSAAEFAAVVIEMMESYDPSRQAVVTAAFKGGNPISIKMKLNPPTVVDDAPGVH